MLNSKWKNSGVNVINLDINFGFLKKNKNILTFFGTNKKSCIFTKNNIMSADKEAKLKALQLTLDKLDKTYGKGTVMKLGDSAVEEVDSIPSGSLGIDLALGVNGYPRGRVIEIYGPESSGKTTLTLHAIAEAQKAGGIAAFIDAEHAFDRFYAEKLGVDIDNLIQYNISNKINIYYY
jgi:predicted ATP-dependent serine protease